MATGNAMDSREIMQYSPWLRSPAADEIIPHLGVWRTVLEDSSQRCTQLYYFGRSLPQTVAQRT
jgi:hypothetical protein